MLLGKKLIAILSITIIFTILTGTTLAKSVYVISDTTDSNLAAYKIDGSSLVHQTNYICQSHPGGGMGAVGLAIDESEYGQFLFVTFEDENIIELVNAKAMQYVDVVTATGASNLAGIVVDQGRRKVYVVDRRKKYLYVYYWYPRIPELVLDGERVELEGLINNDIGGAWGLALDEENERLYVTSKQTNIRYYDTNDWSHDPNTDYITVTDSAIGIAIDVNDGYIYTGSGFFGTYLSKYNLSTDTETRVNVGSPVLGIAVDQDTSLVYITTFSGGTNPDRLIIYDSNLVKQPWDSGDIGNPAGVAVGTTVTYKPPLLKLTKVDNAGPDNRPSPGDYITYTITYDANGHSVSDVNIVDYLPSGVDFNSASDGGDYDSNSHTVTWSIGSLSPTDSNYVTLNVRIDQNAPVPLETIINFCEMESDSSYNTTYCLIPDIIYVDADANDGNDTGMSWRNAYLDLQSALARAGWGGGSEIWVAKGTYRPTADPDDDSGTFELVNGVAMYGGFAGTETALSQRNWVRNPTVLSGDIDNDGDRDVQCVVTASDVNEATIVDGFTIKMGSKAGVYSKDGGSPTIQHNKITENHSGVESYYSGLNITNCLIYSNGYNGIYCDGESTEVVNIKNSWICGNGTGGNGFGISSFFGLNIRNNTIANNANGYGISAEGNSDVTSCIIWGNGLGSLDPRYGNYDVTYSCIEGSYSGQGNINEDPLFYDDPNDPNNYHLSSDSNCIDAGDPGFADFNETDIDGEPRIVDGNEDGIERVDIGADEFYRSPADFDRNGIVNFIDYRVLASAWQTIPNDNDYNDICDLANNNSIDNNDLDVFCDDWLWEPAWVQPIETMMMMGGAMGGGMSLGLEVTTAEFYSVMTATAAGQQSAKMEPEQIEQLIKWLEEIWLGEDLPKGIDKDEWQRGIERIIESLKEELQN